MTVLTGALFGLAPALLGASSKDLQSRLKLAGRRAAAQEGRKLLRGGLVAAEVALAFIAIVAAGLFVRSLQEGHSVDPGFDPDGLVTFSINIGRAGYEPARGAAFYQNALEKLRGLPGVRAAALSETPPVAITPFRALVPEGEVEDPTRFGPAVTVNVVSDGYFETLGTRLVDGRVIEASDRDTTRRVSVVTQALVDRFWPGESGVGHRFRIARTETLYEIVGIVEDTVVRNVLDDPAPVAYFALQQSYVPKAVVNLRAEGSAVSILGTARTQMRVLDATLAVTNEAVVSDVLADGLWGPRIGAALLSLFGLLALALATVGVYGVLAYAVSRRTQEVGVRLVFGATRVQIYRLLIGEGMRPALLGLATGILSALALTHYSAGLLFRVSPNDTATFTAAAAILTAVAFVACALSVRRAARLEPTAALRSD